MNYKKEKNELGQILKVNAVIKNGKTISVIEEIKIFK